MKRPALYICVLLMVAALAPTVHAEENEAPTGKLMVVWTSADPDVAEKVCLMYAHAAKKYGWFAEIHLVVWGPSQRLLVGDPMIQAKVKAMQEDGVVVEACVACATKLGLV
ncbi:MAG: DsrE family protein, partial [Acidobacteriota bacterium]|nr:DsrE family protein [Acidobacteriota bacterium]